MQRVMFFLGGAAILALSFFGTLYLLDSMNLQSMDTERIAHAKALKEALERYKVARGKYPAPYNDNGLADLKADLIDGGFMEKLPVDPYWKHGRVNQYRYRSDGGTYALLFYMELGPCLSGVGPSTERPWDGRKITTCPF